MSPVDSRAVSQNCALTLQFTPIASVTPPSPQAPNPVTLPASEPPAVPIAPGAPGPTPSATHPGQLTQKHSKISWSIIIIIIIRRLSVQATLGWSGGTDLSIHIMFLSHQGRRFLEDALRGEPWISGIRASLKEPMRNPFCMAGL